MPNSLVPAAATGLPKSTRRRVIAGLAAAPMLATVPATSLASPSPTFAELGASLAALKDRHAVLNAEYDRAFVAARKRYGRPPPTPRLLWSQANTWCRQMYQSEERRKRYAARIARIDDEIGLSAVREAIAAVREDQDHIEEILRSTPALTLPSLVAKAKAVKAGECQLNHVIVNDLLGLFGGTRG